MQIKQLANNDFRTMVQSDSRLRLQTIVRLRWLAIMGQLISIAVIAIGLGFPVPIGACLICIALSAWLNVYLSIRYPARHRLTVGYATAMLAYDIIQLTALLFLTGGIQNPFIVLIVAPVTVSAATLPIGNTVLLGVLAIAASTFITFHSLPLPWFPDRILELPFLYSIGMVISVIISMTFLALYAWRLTMESRQMSAALAATELILAREQKLHALDGLAAAAAHELGTPLSTIALITKELEQQYSGNTLLKEDITLLRMQALRCREILQKLTRHPTEQDPLHTSLLVREMLQAAAAPYQSERAPIYVQTRPIGGGEAREPIGVRRPGVIYGIGNIIENAADFAHSRVDVTAEWDAGKVIVTVTDDGPGFKPEVIDSIGEPYVTTRPAGSRKSKGESSGLGLGFFIAKTLLERSGARLVLDNRKPPLHGAVVQITWSRAAFEEKPETAAGASPTVSAPTLTALELHQR